MHLEREPSLCGVTETKSDFRNSGRFQHLEQPNESRSDGLIGGVATLKLIDIFKESQLF